MNLLRALIQLALTPMPGLLRKPVLRILGAKIHPSARISIGAVVVASEVQIGPQVIIRPLSAVLLGGALEMDSSSYISNFCLVHGSGSFRAGARSALAVGCLIDCSSEVILGEYSGIGAKSCLMSHGSFWPGSWGYRAPYEPIVIEPQVWVAMCCNIGPGVTIAGPSIVMAGSTVTNSITKPGIVHQSAGRTTAYPMTLAARKMTRTRLVDHFCHGLKELSNHLDGWSYEEQEDGALLRKGRHLVQIDWFQSKERNPAASEQWLFAYHQDKTESSSSSNQNVQILDFGLLLYSKPRSKWFKAAIDHFRKYHGMRTADAQYRDSFALLPPPVEGLSQDET